MKRFRFVFLAVCIVLVSPVAFFPVSPAHAIQCSIERPSNAQSWWSYRLIDGRKCWYEGKPMLSKSLLEWPETSPKPVSNRQVTSVAPEKPLDSQAWALKDFDTFEARWRERVEMR